MCSNIWARPLSKRSSPVLWLTGLPSSGKSTLARALAQAIEDRGERAHILDGDDLRRGLCRDLGFSREDRAENSRRVAEVARLFADAGVVAIVALISPYAEDRAIARGILEDHAFVEVFVDCAATVCEARDAKGLYRQARAGLVAGFTGVGAPYEAPESPDLHLRSDCSSLEEEVDAVLTYLKLPNLGAGARKFAGTTSQNPDSGLNS